MRPAIALDVLSTRLAGTCQGFATPCPADTPWTEPVQPRRGTLYEGEDRLTTSVNQLTRLSFGWTKPGGRPIRNKVVKPLLAAAHQSRPPRGSQNPTSIDRHYQTIHMSMHAVFQELGLAG